MFEVTSHTHTFCTHSIFLEFCNCLGTVPCLWDSKLSTLAKYVNTYIVARVFKREVFWVWIS